MADYPKEGSHSESRAESSIYDIRIERVTSDSHLSELGIRSWPKMKVCKENGVPCGDKLTETYLERWGCPPGKFPLKYDAQETCYFLRGKVRAYMSGSASGGDGFVEFGAGDLVVIPKGLSCIWDVTVAVDKHYKFDCC